MKLKRIFFERDVLEVAPDLLGKLLVIKRANGLVEKKTITETEAYGGEEDMASHARFGKTKRNEVMYGKSGVVYVYFIYGVYWMLNIITGKKGEAQGVLIRGLEGIKGPGKVGKWLELDKGFYGEDLTSSKRIWIDHTSPRLRGARIVKTKRVGVGYAGKWAEKKWRFTLTI